MLISPRTFLDVILDNIHYKGVVKGRVHASICGFADDFFVSANYLTWCTSINRLNHLLSQHIPMAIISSCTRHNNIPDNVTIIPAENPLSLFDSCVSAVYHKANTSPKIGNNCEIHNSVVIGNNVVIGDCCRIGAHVTIGDDSHIHDNVTIESNSVIGSFPFSNYPNESNYERKIWGGVVIGSNSHVGSCTTIDKGFTIATQIGDNCKIGNHVEIAHDVLIGNNCLISAQAAIAGNVVMEDNCYLWAKSGIINRIHVAEGTVLYATSILTKDTKKGDELCGFPARNKRQYWKQQAKLGSL